MQPSKYAALFITLQKSWTKYDYEIFSFLSRFQFYWHKETNTKNIKNIDYQENEMKIKKICKINIKKHCFQLAVVSFFLGMS